MNIVQIFSREDIEAKKFSKINMAHKKAHIKSIMAYSIFFPVVSWFFGAKYKILQIFGYC